MVMKAVIKRVYQNSILTEHVIKVVNIMVVIIFWACCLLDSTYIYT